MLYDYQGILEIILSKGYEKRFVYLIDFQKVQLNDKWDRLQICTSGIYL